MQDAGVRSDASELKERFYAHKVHEEGRRPNTARMYVRRLGYWEALTGKPIHLVSARDARDFKVRSEWATDTQKGMIVALRQFHAFGALEGLWEQNGIMLVKVPKVENDTPPPLSIDTARFLIHACRSPLEFRLIYLGLYGGLRIGESADIRPSHWTDDGLRFRGEKSRKFRTVPAHPNLEALKHVILTCEPWGPCGLQKVKQRISERTGIGFVSHQLRHTFAQALTDLDVPDRVVKALLGHAGGVTDRYRMPNRTQLREAVLALPY